MAEGPDLEVIDLGVDQTTETDKKKGIPDYKQPYIVLRAGTEKMKKIPLDHDTYSEIAQLVENG